MPQKKIVFATHVASVDGKEYDGIGNVLHQTLANLVKPYIHVRNSIDGKLRSEVRHYGNGRVTKTASIGVVRKPGPIRYLSEIIQTTRYFMKQDDAIDAYIGIDPLNAFVGIILRRFNKARLAIFYTADYSRKRFDNPVLNYLYHLLDRYCVRHADEVWSVSTRICAVRKQMGLEDKKNIFVPNVPPRGSEGFAGRGHNKYELITTGIIDKQLDFEGVIRALSEMTQDVPQLHLTIVGNGPEEARLRSLVQNLGLEGKVKFTGRLPLLEALELQSTAGIGLALYTGAWGFNQFGDSTKCREYFNFGLPVISTDTHSTVGDIKKWRAGIVVEKSVEAYKRAILDILEGYDSYSENSLRAGLEYKDIHCKLLSGLFDGRESA